jgi:hypothetical protein
MISCLWPNEAAPGRFLAMLTLGRVSGRATRATSWFLTAAASVSTLMLPTTARAFVQVHGAAFSPVALPLSSYKPAAIARGAHSRASGRKQEGAGDLSRVLSR